MSFPPCELFEESLKTGLDVGLQLSGSDLFPRRVTNEFRDCRNDAIERVFKKEGLECAANDWLFDRAFDLLDLAL